MLELRLLTVQRLSLLCFSRAAFASARQLGDQRDRAGARAPCAGGGRSGEPIAYSQNSGKAMVESQ